MSKIQLFESQKQHVKVLTSILQFSPFALDLSMLGTGKTYTSSYICLNGVDSETKFKHIIVIAPLSVLAKWEYMRNEYNIPLVAGISYASLRSQKNKQPKHGFLKRVDYEVKVEDKFGNSRSVQKVMFEATEKYIKLCKEGLLLIVDEIQNTKNVSDQFLAVKELAHPILQSGISGKSRIIALSGSPIDKKEHSIVLMRMLGIMKSDVLSSFNPGTYVNELIGAQEIQDFCMEIDEQTTRSILRHDYMDNITTGYILPYCYDLFQNVVKKHLSSFMLPEKSSVQLYKKNVAYMMSNEDAEKLNNAISGLASTVGWKNGNIDLSGSTKIGTVMALLQESLMDIEYSKLNTMARITRQTLENNANRKVVICVNYTFSISELCYRLNEFNPLVLNGSTNLKQRTVIINKFQKNNGLFRLLIVNIKTASTGIDLDDKFGDFPRTVLINPNYSAIDLYQLSHRFLRLDTKSNSDIHFVCGKCPNGIKYRETNILNALARKSDVMKETTREQVDNGVCFPSDFPEFEENEDGSIICSQDIMDDTYNDICTQTHEINKVFNLINSTIIDTITDNLVNKIMLHDKKINKKMIKNIIDSVEI